MNKKQTIQPQPLDRGELVDALCGHIIHDVTVEGNTIHIGLKYPDYVEFEICLDGTDEPIRAFKDQHDENDISGCYCTNCLAKIEEEDRKAWKDEGICSGCFPLTEENTQINPGFGGFDEFEPEYGDGINPIVFFFLLRAAKGLRWINRYETNHRKLAENAKLLHRTDAMVLRNGSKTQIEKYRGE